MEFGTYECCTEKRAENCICREPEQSASILDSQSVKITETPGVRGFDAGKKVKGRRMGETIPSWGAPFPVG